MGFFDIIANILGNAAKSQTQALNEYERKLKEAERRGVNTEEQRIKLQEAREKLNAAKEKISPDKDDIEAWDKKWVSIGKLVNANLSPLNNVVGLYKHVVKGEVKYIGRATEWNNGGLRKRLSDYRRGSDSARKHSSGRAINENLSEITTYVLIVGSDAEAAAKTKYLEPLFIDYYAPEWNIVYRWLCF